jgi:hypothetical protein
LWLWLRLGLRASIWLKLCLWLTIWFRLRLRLRWLWLRWLWHLPTLGPRLNSLLKRWLGSWSAPSLRLGGAYGFGSTGWLGGPEWLMAWAMDFWHGMTAAAREAIRVRNVIGVARLELGAGRVAATIVTGAAVAALTDSVGLAIGL